MRFENREDAGRALARELREWPLENGVIVALPRGGVVVGEAVARSLGLPLDVMIVRKLGAPHQPELGLGAIAEGGVRWVDERLVAALRVTEDELERITRRESDEVRRRALAFRGGEPFPDIEGRPVVLVDDGIATGGTIRAALRTLRRFRPSQLLVAVPVAAQEALESLRGEADDVIALLAPDGLGSVGEWYDDFAQVEDDEVRRLLAGTRRPGDVPSVGAREYAMATDGGLARVVQVATAGVHLAGDLLVPANASGLVVFAHGSGSSRRSTRNKAVAERLRQEGCATLLFDLLTGEEEDEDRITSAFRFDLPLLVRRLVGAVDWVRARGDVGQLPIGLFGASTGAAAALAVASLRPSVVRAVVSRGGRPDLAESSLPLVRAPTLLIVGGADEGVLELNEQAFEALRCEKRLAVVPGATHLFEEHGALDEVSRLAARWFLDHFREEAGAGLSR